MEDGHEESEETNEEENDPQESTVEDADLSDAEKQETLNWSGSGIWEKTENRRWIAVTNHHRIPCRKRSISECSMIRDTGTGQFVNRFEIETSQDPDASQNFRVVVSRESMIRLNNQQSAAAGSSSGDSFSAASTAASSQALDHQEPVPGPSHASGHPSHNNSRVSSSRIDALLRRRVRRKKSRGKRRSQRKRRAAKKCTPRKRIVVAARSTDSSPGRGSPSPTSLARICLYWEQRLASPEYVILSDPESEP